MKLFLLLFRRYLKARKLGFTFLGTTKSKLPLKVNMGGELVELIYPSDSGYMLDLVNLWLDDEYGLQKVELKSGVVVDIGGNIGLFSLWAWGNFPDARIYTYEPNPRVFEALTKNLAPTGAQLFQVGVGSKAGRAKMIDSGNSRMATTAMEREGELEIITLSQIVESVGGRIDLLKMDCEGAEWDIFDDLKAFDSVQSIRMEYHLSRERSIDDLVTVVEGLGFHMKHHVPNVGFGIAWFERE